MIQEKQLFRIRGDTGSGACAGGDQGEEDTQIGEASASHGHYSAWSWLLRLTQHFLSPCICKMEGKPEKDLFGYLS